MTIKSTIPSNVLPVSFKTWAEAVSDAADSLPNYALKGSNLSDLTNIPLARSNLGLGTAATQADTKYSHRGNNLSDLADVSIARSNLGLGTAATHADTRYTHRSNNLSDLGSASDARTNLGLGSAATRADTRYAHRSNNLSDLASASTARSNLGLGSAATQNDTRYAHRSNNLSDLANTSTARTNIGAHDAGNLTTGILPVARLPTSGVDAGSLTVGTLPAARLPASGVNAGSLTTGTLPAARLPAGVFVQESLEVTLGGDFGGTNNFEMVRVGIMVVGRLKINAAHSSASSIASASAIIPLAWRPASNVQFSLRVSGGFQFCQVLSSGDVLVSYVNDSGASLSRTSALQFQASWITA